MAAAENSPVSAAVPTSASRRGAPAARRVTPASTFDLGEGMGDGARWAALGAVVAALVLGLLGLAVGSQLLRGLGLGLFLLLGLGVGPLLLVPRISALWFGVLALTTSLTVSLAVGMAMAVSHQWHPVVAFVLVAVATVVLLALGAVRLLARRRAGTGPVRAPRSDLERRRDRVVLVLTGGGLFVAAVTAAVQPMSPQRGGLYLSLGPVWWLGLAAVLAALVVAVRWQRSPAAPVLALSTVVVLSQALTYGAPTVMSAARHVGIVDYIRVNGGVDRELDIFQAWSGLFAGVAWVADVAGIRDVLVVATWWPVVLSPLLAAATAALAGRWLADHLRPWLAGGVFLLSATLNIVYFSPQSFGLLAGLVVLALVVPLVAGPGDPRPADAPAGSPARATALLPGSGGLARIAVVLLLACVMAFTHQISPYLTVAALVVLTVFGYVRPWWTFLVVLVPAVAWALLNQSVLGGFVSIEAIGRLWDNVQPPTYTFAQYPQPPITRIAFYLPALALLAVGLLALLRLVTGRERRLLALAVAAASPIGLLVATDYGSEGIFRASLFAGPWLAILAMSFPWRPDRWHRVVLPAALVALFAVNAFSQTALDWNRVVRTDAAAATRVFEHQAPDDALVLLTGTTNATPLNISARYLDLGYISRENLGGYPAPSSSYDADADVAAFTAEFLRIRPATDYYALVSDSIGAYDERYGLQSYADYEQLGAAMARSPLWEPVFSGPTTTLYHLRPTR